MRHRPVAHGGLQAAIERADEAMLAHRFYEFGNLDDLARVEGVGVNIGDMHISQLGAGMGADQALNGLILSAQEVGAAEGAVPVHAFSPCLISLGQGAVGLGAVAARGKGQGAAVGRRRL
ncbi:MAG: hypothetical protein IPH87_23185 [Anaerolineae bacterium]|nr:hypothetical protein [Anaerolineae bacterium]